MKNRMFSVETESPKKKYRYRYCNFYSKKHDKFCFKLEIGSVYGGKKSKRPDLIVCALPVSYTFLMSEFDFCFIIREISLSIWFQ